MTAQEILDIIEAGGYCYYGLRRDDGVVYELGDAVADSRVWVDGEPTEDTLDGVSCFGLHDWATEGDVENALRLLGDYYGDRTYLIAGDQMMYGEDAGEYVIKGAVVVGVL